MRISDCSSDLCSSDLYFRLSDLAVSSDGRLMAYAVDDNGSERFEVRVRNLETGEMLPDVIPGTLSSLVWTAGSDALLYGLANENWRTDNVRLHLLGTPVTDPKFLYHESAHGFGRSEEHTTDI